VPREARHDQPHTDEYGRDRPAVRPLPGPVRTAIRRRAGRGARRREPLLRPVLRAPGPRVPPGPGVPHPRRSERGAVHEARGADAACGDGGARGGERGVAGPHLRAEGRAVQRRPQPRDLLAGGSRGVVGRAARGSPVLRDVRPRAAAAVANVPDARGRPRGHALLRRTDHRSDRGRKASRPSSCGWRTRRKARTAWRS
jgi:hypothetical protein